jgi:hypothetical protein
MSPTGFHADEAEITKKARQLSPGLAFFLSAFV